MSIINQILTDFYYATHIPIQFLDDHLKQVDVMGKTARKGPPFKMKGQHLSAITTLTTDDAHHYIVLPFNETSHQTGYFLIGAYQSFDQESREFPYKPSHLTPHFEELLISIVKKNIASDVACNPHIEKGIRYIQAHYHEAINLPQLCDYLNLNMCYFCVLFKNHTTMTFSQYLNRLRINESKRLLEKTNDSIIEISLSVGFNNHNHFSATFKKFVGMTPTAYRNQVKNK
ncbi:MAG: AraC family transcriptional regulator [Defluviitaleaceae bacterium]|nr:AraC family transcriptional regulator [Defluviitaleaceae bacterium]